jgi:hypothetical protein
MLARVYMIDHNPTQGPRGGGPKSRIEWLVSWLIVKWLNRPVIGLTALMGPTGLLFTPLFHIYEVEL